MSDNKEKNNQNRPVVFLSQDLFVREIYSVAAKSLIKKTILLIASYSQLFIDQIVKLNPLRIILHRPAKWVLQMIFAYRSKGWLDDIEVEIEPIEGSISIHTDIHARVSTHTEAQNQIVQAAISGESTAETARKMRRASATVRSERAKLQPEIIQVRSLLDKVRQK